MYLDSISLQEWANMINETRFYAFVAYIHKVAKRLGIPLYQADSKIFEELKEKGLMY